MLPRLFILYLTIQVLFILNSINPGGYELFCDLCLAYLLITCKISNEIVLHIKRMPWFVSDTTQSDLCFLMERLRVDPTTKDLHTAFKSCIDQKLWIIKTDVFWTMPMSFHKMNIHAQVLFNEMFMSPDTCCLVIFKGDLNYRKILNDEIWEVSTKFEDTIGCLRESHVPLLALRTCKSETLSGLEAGISDQVYSIDSNWKINGKWGISLSFYR